VETGNSFEANLPGEGRSLKRVKNKIRAIMVINIIKKACLGLKRSDLIVFLKENFLIFF